MGAIRMAGRDVPTVTLRLVAASFDLIFEGAKAKTKKDILTTRKLRGGSLEVVAIFRTL